MCAQVSIIIPNKNKEAYLRETLDSVIAQTYQHWEAIIVDDASTDNSKEIIRSYTDKDDRIQLIVNDISAGGSACRNIGIKNSKGRFIIFFDSDDLLEEFCIEERMLFQEQFPSHDFWVFTMKEFLDDVSDGCRLWKLKQDGNHLGRFLSMDLAPWQTMQPLWDRRFVERIHGYDIEYPRFQDIEFHVRALLQAGVSYRVSTSKIPDCYYRILRRRGQAGAEFAASLVSGANMYISKIHRLLKKDKRFIGLESRKLRAVSVASLGHVFHVLRVGDITRHEAVEIVNEMKAHSAFEVFDTRLSRWIFLLYCRMGFSRSFNVKGIKRLIQRTIPLV